MVIYVNTACIYSWPLKPEICYYSKLWEGSVMFELPYSQGYNVLLHVHPQHAHSHIINFCP